MRLQNLTHYILSDEFNFDPYQGSIIPNSLNAINFIQKRLIQTFVHDLVQYSLDFL